MFGSATAQTVPMRDAVRASWAIPGWYPPVELAGDRFVDGGVTSTASADAVIGAGLDEVVVVAPMASVAGVRVPGPGGLVEGLMRRQLSRVLEAEITALRAAGTRVLSVHPTARDLAAMGPNFMNPRRCLAALDIASARRSGRLSFASEGMKQ